MPDIISPFERPLTLISFFQYRLLYVKIFFLGDFILSKDDSHTNAQGKSKGVRCGIMEQSRSTTDAQFSESSHRYGKLQQYDFSKTRRQQAGQFDWMNAKYECRCGRNLTVSEQWQFATDLCPPLNLPWRQSDDWFGCTNGATPYDSNYVRQVDNNI